MKHTIEHYISNLLYLHDCVIIPDFGGFVGSKKSAYIHPVSGIIHPPSKAILFNKNLMQNDGLLATHIAKEERIDLVEVGKKIKEFVEKINSELEKRSAFKLSKIGTLTKGKEGNISFVQNKNYNYNLASFGMQANHKNKKVERTTAQEKEAIVKSIKQQDLGKTLRKAAAVLIPLIGLSLIGIIQEENINGIYSQMANLNPFANSKTEIILETTSEEIVVTIPIEKTETIIKEQHNYYIIAGAFSEKNNANKMLFKLKKWNYKASIVEGGNLTRVAYSSFTNREDAIVALNDIKKDNPSAWLLTK